MPQSGTRFTCGFFPERRLARGWKDDPEVQRLLADLIKLPQT
ncbi:MAG: hypothetical protein ABSH44_03400 [Bryobacteraceae bacterium]|jgi:hypothetical protein